MGWLPQEYVAAGVPFEVRVESSSSSTSLFLVAAGAGIGVVDSTGGLGEAFPGLTMRDFVPRIESRVLLLHARDRPRSRIAAAFAKKLSQMSAPPVQLPARRRLAVAAR